MAKLAMATVLVEAGERSGTRHQVQESLLCQRPVFVSGHLMMEPNVSWPRQLFRKPGVFTFVDGETVVGRLREALAARSDAVRDRRVSVPSSSGRSLLV